MGQIIPAIATTTAAVAGLLGLELFKLVGGPRPCSAFRHSYLLLAWNCYSRSVPRAPAVHRVRQHPPLTPPAQPRLPLRPHSQLRPLAAPRPRSFIPLSPFPLRAASLRPVRHRK